ncbi:MAG: hypothetical protein AAF628_32905 [Planctomycetota bacterium]
MTSGNVWERCLDGYDGMDGDPDIEVADPLRASADVPQRVRRGGDFSGVAKSSVPAMSAGSFPEFTISGLEVRTARAIERSRPSLVLAMAVSEEENRGALRFRDVARLAECLNEFRRSTVRSRSARPLPGV